MVKLILSSGNDGVQNSYVYRDAIVSGPNRNRGDARRVAQTLIRVVRIMASLGPCAGW